MAGPAPPELAATRKPARSSRQGATLEPAGPSPLAAPPPPGLLVRVGPPAPLLRVARLRQEGPPPRAAALPRVALRVEPKPRVALPAAEPAQRLTAAPARRFRWSRWNSSNRAARTPTATSYGLTAVASPFAPRCRNCWTQGYVAPTPAFPPGRRQRYAMKGVASCSSTHTAPSTPIARSFGLIVHRMPRMWTPELPAPARPCTRATTRPAPWCRPMVDARAHFHRRPPQSVRSSGDAR
jgi:hypothetical protein